jgi:rhodanese-related sulfurtransferase
MSKETFDTLGHQKATNYALRADMTKAEFVKEVTTGLMPPPAYFPLNVALNKQGYDSIDDVMKRGTQPLSPRAFEVAANETSALILDTRDPQVFAKGFVPNAINIGIDGSFAPWVGALIPDVKQELLIITESGREEEVVTRLARVGYDYCLGYLDGGIEAWEKAGLEVDRIESISPEELAARLAKTPDAPVFDVRKKSEYDSEHLEVAENAPLDFVNESMLLMPKDKTTYIHCAGGYRSMIFTSILRARGYENLVEVQGGFKALKETEMFKITDYVCPSTLL